MKTKIWKAPMGVFAIFFVFILALFLQYLYLSLSPSVYGINMQKFADNRNTYSNVLYAKRGTIYDNNDDILATSVSSYTVIAYLDASRTGSSKTLYHVVDKAGTAKALAPLINMSEETIYNLLNQKLYQVELGPGGRGITEVLKNKIESLNLPGIDFIESYKRYYPNGDFASYLIGYTKKQEQEIEINGKKKIQDVINGELGIEVYYNDILNGTNGYTVYQQDKFGYKIPDTKEDTVEAINGSDIYLTIDSNIQRILDTATSEAEEYNPEWMTITVMDAKTGDILGSSSTPSYDPNKLNITNYENPLTSFLYEPGSVMKIYTYMCAVEKGTYKGDETFLSGSIEYEDNTVYDWKRDGWGEISFDYGFEMSSNVAASYITQRFVNKEELKQCFTNYGFGNNTGIELPREFAGKISFNYPIEVAAASYGQGIFTTPIQHLQALSIIANDGYMVEPHIVSKIVDNGTVTYQREVSKTKKVSKETSDKIKQLMYDTVHDVEHNATGASYNVPNLDVIGKTGTAQIYSNELGRYYLNEYIYSFSGIFPKDDPEIIIFASIKKPTTGNSIRTITRKAIESIANYKGLLNNSSINNNIKKYELPNLINSNISNIKKLEQNGLKVITIGDGDTIIKQYPSSGTLLTGDNVILLTNGNVKMPNLIGLSKIEVVALLNMIDIEYEIEGTGFVTEQSIKKDSKIEGMLKVTLKEKYKIE